MNAVVLAFDRLNVGLLGCYGNLEVTTPSLDRLAAESIVFDQHFGENFDAEAANHTWWTGSHNFPRPHDQQRKMPVVLELLRSAGVRSWLVRQQSGRRPLWTSSGIDSEFDEVDISTEDSADDENQSLSVAVDRTLDRLHRLAESSVDCVFLWASFAGLSPAASPSDTGDAYVAEVTKIDQELGRLLDTIRSLPAPAQPLLVVTAAAGVPLPERDEWDISHGVLNDCLIHTPLMVRLPSKGTSETGSRRQQLVQTTDLVPSLLDWFDIESTGFTPEGRSWFPLLKHDRVNWRDHLFLGDATRVCGVRTPDFWLVDTGIGSDESPDKCRLFIKPEDIWDMHDVAQQAPQHAKQLRTALHQFVADSRATRETYREH